MNTLSLNIAGYNIRFDASDCDIGLSPGRKFERFIVHGGQPSHLLIRLHSGVKMIPAGATKVFSAALSGEILDPEISHSSFFSIWEYEGDHLIKVSFPLENRGKNAVLKFSLQPGDWDLWIDAMQESVDPLEYPLDGLILYYTTAVHGDIMLHSSGTNFNGKGYIFSGVSGKGKSTMAGLWHERGAAIVHDDRLILRKTGHSYTMYNTPVYDADEPRNSRIDKIFIIEHGVENKLENVSGAKAVSLVMANCIQHNWGPEIISRLLDSVTDLCSNLPVFRLSFKPDSNVTDYIMKNE